jgi:hypothetical protein
MFAVVRIHLKARDTKHAQQTTHLNNHKQTKNGEVRGLEQEERERIGEKEDRKEQESEKEGKQTTKVSSGNTRIKPNDVNDVPSW